MITATILLILFYVYKKRFKKPVKAPEAVANRFKEEFPQVQEVTWYKYKNTLDKKVKLFEAYFMIDNVGRSVCYTTSGERIL